MFMWISNFYSSNEHGNKVSLKKVTKLPSVGVFISWHNVNLVMSEPLSPFFLPTDK